LLSLTAMRLLLGFAVVTVIGCTHSDFGPPGGPPPAGGVQGDTISAVVTSSDGAGGTTSEARILIGTTTTLCSDASASPPIDRKDTQFMTIALSDVTGAMRTAPAAPATYTIYPDSGSEPPKSASLVTGGFDTTCQPIDADTAQGQSGTVTLTSVSGGAYAGSFDVVLNTGGHVTGTFSPEACPQLGGGVADEQQA
jgi:hypothetical protein